MAVMPVATIPLVALRVAEGKLAVTFDDAGCDPRSVILNVSDLERVMSEVDRHVRTSFGRARHDEGTHVLARLAAQEVLGGATR
jgi:hypothetical protein